MRNLNINPETLYTPHDDAMRIIGAVPTLARWRCEKSGPSWIKAGRKILYRGSDVLAWMEAQRVDTGNAA